MNLRVSLAAVAAAAVLAGCGGGGTDFLLPPPVNAQAAWQNLYSAERNWTLTSTSSSDGLAYTLNLSLHKGGDLVFPLTGAVGSVRYWDALMTATGKPTTSGRGTQYHDPSTLALMGTQGADAYGNPLCTKANSSVLPPSQTAVGTSGLQAQIVGYSGCDPTSPPSGVTGTVNWSVQSSQGVPYLCTTSLSQEAVGGTYYRETDCFETDANGLIGGRATVRIDSGDVTATGLTATWSVQLSTP